MKVLVVTPLYPSPGDGEAGVFIHRQIQRLSRQGADCRVLAFRPAPPPFPLWLRRRAWLRYYLERLRWTGRVDGVPVDVVFYRREWTPGEDVVPAIGGALGAWVEAHPEWRGADVVYAQFLWPSAAAALSLRERFGWPIAGILRGGDVQEWYDNNPHCRTHVQRVLTSADVLLANCEALRQRAGELQDGVDRRIEVVYNGCDAARFRPAADRPAVRRALGYAGEERLLLMCGSIEERKGVRVLCEAWRRFAPGHPEWRLAVVGRHVDAALVAALHSAGGDRIRLTGLLPSDDVLRYMQAADLYVQPSHLEGLANATMEAMAVGVPVISTDAWGQRELVRDGENGWLVPPGDVDALVDALERAAADPSGAARLGAEGRRTIERRFDPDEHAARLHGLLHDATRSMVHG